MRPCCFKKWSPSMKTKSCQSQQYRTLEYPSHFPKHEWISYLWLGRGRMMALSITFSWTPSLGNSWTSSQQLTTTTIQAARSQEGNLLKLRIAVWSTFRIKSRIWIGIRKKSCLLFILGIQPYAFQSMTSSWWTELGSTILLLNLDLKSIGVLAATVSLSKKLTTSSTGWHCSSLI